MEVVGGGGVQRKMLSGKIFVFCNEGILAPGQIMFFKRSYGG